MKIKDLALCGSERMRSKNEKGDDWREVFRRCVPLLIRLD